VETKRNLEELAEIWGRKNKEGRKEGRKEGFKVIAICLQVERSQASLKLVVGTTFFPMLQLLETLKPHSVCIYADCLRLVIAN